LVIYINVDVDFNSMASEFASSETLAPYFPIVFYTATVDNGLILTYLLSVAPRVIFPYVKHEAV
jgi:hypothetical protein